MVCLHVVKNKFTRKVLQPILKDVQKYFCVHMKTVEKGKDEGDNSGGAEEDALADNPLHIFFDK